MADLGVAHLAVGQTRRRGRDAVSCVCGYERPQLVEHRRPSQRDRVARAVGREPPAVEHDQDSRRRRQLVGTRGANSAHQRGARRRSPRTTRRRGSRRRPARRRRRAARAARRVVGLDAAAVQHPRALRLLARAVGDQRADERDRLLGLLGGRDLAGPDRPDRLVRDHDLAEPLGLDPGQILLDLVAELALGVAGLALLLGLADAQDRHEAGRERRRDLQLERPVGLAEQLAPLGVAEDHAVDADLDQHRRRHLAGERALGRLVHVLRVDLDPRAARRVDHRLQRRERRADRDVDPVGRSRPAAAAPG